MPAMTAAHTPSMQAGPPLSRAGSLPQGVSMANASLANSRNLCGSEPARDDGGTYNINASWPTAIASRLAPTGGIDGERKSCEQPKSLWEPGLPAMTAAHTTSTQAGPPLSRAGSLPQGVSMANASLANSRNLCGSEPARDDGGTYNIDASWPTAIASRLAPTRGMMANANLADSSLPQGNGVDQMPLDARSIAK
ncbi:hypothetical protein SAMN05216476_4318 [Pseudomonas mediterranea]|uniref:Uncharacterized protein n=1 Tax=Pseudomonas mediterranea TaxID=183795 RepID=A0AAX2DFZ5_9PSED|nr:hypothetical protein SAMN05216476_4318 [Pseudomonas mediterranea]